jgi:hypothetical protein
MKLLKNIALSDTGFVFNPSTGDSFSVNPIGLSILRDLQAGKSESEIKNNLFNQFQIDKETIEKDVYDFLKMIEQFNLLDNHEA